jgi:hypothetical protein
MTTIAAGAWLIACETVWSPGASANRFCRVKTKPFTIPFRILRESGFILRSEIENCFQLG